MKPFFIVILAASLITGCAYQAPVTMSPAYNVYSSYEEDVPGKWAFWVDAERFKDNGVKPSSYGCSAHTFPIDSTNAFEKSALKTFSNLVDSIEKVNSPIPAHKLAESGFDGQIIISGEDLDVDLVFISGFWTMTAEAEVSYEASLSVFLQTGKIIGTTVSAEGEETGAGGGTCSGGAQVIGQAAEDGMKRLLRRLGEKFSSSTRLRENLAKR